MQRFWSRAVDRLDRSCACVHTNNAICALQIDQPAKFKTGQAVMQLRNNGQKPFRVGGDRVQWFFDATVVIKPQPFPWCCMLTGDMNLVKHGIQKNDDCTGCCHREREHFIKTCSFPNVMCGAPSPLMHCHRQGWRYMYSAVAFLRCSAQSHRGQKIQ